MSFSGVFAITIIINNHPQLHGLALNLDDVLACAVAGLIVIGLGLWIRHQVTSEVPGRLQAAYEAVIEAVQRLAARIGPRGPRYVPLVVTLFFFILIANWLEMIPSQPRDTSFQYLPAPTGDVNMTYALALLVIVLVHVESVRARGFRGYFHHYVEPYKVITPINVIEEIAKPITLALRLFGNIFAGGLMLVLISGLLVYVVPPLDIVWKAFDGLFVGPIQALIFSLLTLLYLEFGSATTAH
jgi:F-type H+-transporting ATPase subunit a